MAKANVVQYKMIDGSIFEVPQARKGRLTIIRFFDGSVMRIGPDGKEIKGKQKAARNKNKRHIVINYWGASGAGQPLRSNRAKNPDTAIDSAFMHMRRNDYEAFVAEVFNEKTGELYAVLTHSVVGEIRTMFHYDAKSKTYVQGFEEKVQEQTKLAVEEAKRQEAAAVDTMKHLSRIMTLPTPTKTKEHNNEE